MVILTCKWCQGLSRGGGVPYRKDELEAFSCGVYPSTSSEHSQSRKLPLDFHACAKCILLIDDLFPPLPRCYLRDKMGHTFPPPSFCIL